MNVYFIRSCDPIGHIKVGMADNVNARLETMQTGSPYELELMHSFACLSRGAAYTAESQIHFRFRFCRARREWFKPHPHLKHLIAYLASGGSLSEGLSRVKDVSVGISKKRQAKASA